MPDDETVQQQLQLLRASRATLGHAAHQLVQQGGYAHAERGLLNDIVEYCDNIQRIKAWLRERGVVVDDEENDLLAQRLRMTPGSDGPRAGDTPLGTRIIISRLNSSMSVLRQLMQQVPEIRDAAVAFRTMFQGACAQIETLRVNKILHDQLHQIQFRCFEPIERELPRLLTTGLFDTNVEEYAQNLEDCIAALRDAVADTSLFNPTPTWIDILSQSHAQMLRALQADDVDMLRRAIDSIRRVLNIHPSRINVQLTNAVQTMRLPAIVSTMANIHTICESLNIDAALLERITAGLRALRDLNEQLSSLSFAHTQWQDIDNLLRLLNDSGEEIIDLWNELKTQASRLYATTSEDWANDLQENAARLEQAMQHNDVQKIVQHFRQYRSRAMRRFYQVDTQLQKLCNKLDRVDGPFAFVIGVLE